MFHLHEQVHYGNKYQINFLCEQKIFRDWLGEEDGHGMLSKQIVSGMSQYQHTLQFVQSHLQDNRIETQFQNRHHQH